MINSEYDNEKFFEEYAKMSRSREGLSAAGEWHQFKQMFPDLHGKRVLDLGCGYGWHCTMWKIYPGYFKKYIKL